MEAHKKIEARWIDAFIPYRPPMLTQCDVKGCRNSSRVIMKYRINPADRMQLSARICQGHALHYANEILGHWKFNQGERS